MPDNWEGVLILLAVTAITLVADAARRWMGPPRDPDRYVSPVYPQMPERKEVRTANDDEDDDEEDPHA
jgi:hypothetical protein